MGWVGVVSFGKGTATITVIILVMKEDENSLFMTVHGFSQCMYVCVCFNLYVCQCDFVCLPAMCPLCMCGGGSRGAGQIQDFLLFLGGGGAKGYVLTRTSQAQSPSLPGSRALEALGDFLMLSNAI